MDQPHQPPPSPARTGSRRRILLIGAVLLGVVASAVAFTAMKRDTPAKPPTAREAPPLAVAGIALQTEPFQEMITSSGTLRAEEAIEVQTQVNGKIVAIHFTEGERVEEGKLLVKIDDSSLQASLRRAEARRNLGLLKERRLANLVTDGGISVLDYDVAKAELEVLDAEVEIIRADIAKTEIRAPFEGLIGLRFVSVGAYVNPATRIATLQRLARMKIEFSVPERYGALIRPGAPVLFTVAGGTTTYQASVMAVDPRVDVSTRTIQLRALCDNPDAALLPGLFARVEFEVSKSDAALLVPAIAVLSGLEERFVFVARDGKAVRTRVKTGARTPTHVQIVEGLSAGDVVLTTGVQQLRSGMAVKVSLPAS